MKIIPDMIYDLIKRTFSLRMIFFIILSWPRAPPSFALAAAAAAESETGLHAKWSGIRHR